jgi:hypothetical protein
MKHSVLGFSTTDVEQIRQAVEQALGIIMIPHDSLYFGEYYLWEGRGNEGLQLVLNEDPLDGEPFEVGHSHLGTLLYASLGIASYASYMPLLSSSVPSIYFIREEEDEF